MKNALLTVFIAAYNHEQYIRQALDGVLNQKTSYKYKIIITDDASSDQTQSIIQEYINNNPNIIFPVFNEKNIGYNATFKKALPLIDTKYTCLLGGDDFWIDENKIEKEVDYLEAHPETSYVHTGYREWIEEKDDWGASSASWEWKMPVGGKNRLISFFNNDCTYYPCSSTCCFRTNVLMKCFNQYPQILDYTFGEGILLHSAMCMYGGGYHYIPDYTTAYRVRKSSMSHYTDIQGQLKYMMGYPSRKITTFKLFDISVKQYKRVIEKNLDSLFLLAYSNKAIDFYCGELQHLGIDNCISRRYIIYSSNRLLSFLYYLFLRRKSLLRLIFTKASFTSKTKK